MATKIMLDPGHGAGIAHNRGFKKVEGYGNCNEGDQNYIFCTSYLKPALEKRGFKVGITRSKIEDNPTLQKRGEMASGYDLLISSHTNAGGGSGIEIWDSTNPKEKIPDLTNKITKEISELLCIPNRGTKYKENSRGANWYGILRHGQAKHNIIIEWVFHDNYSDAEKYLANMKKIADKAADILAEYFDVSDNANKSPEKHWADKEIKQVIENGYMQGDERGFRPDDPVTRAEMAVILSRLDKKLKSF